MEKAIQRGLAMKIMNIDIRYHEPEISELERKRMVRLQRSSLKLEDFK